MFRMLLHTLRHVTLLSIRGCPEVSRNCMRFQLNHDITNPDVKATSPIARKKQFHLPGLQKPARQGRLLGHSADQIHARIEFDFKNGPGCCKVWQSICRHRHIV